MRSFFLVATVLSLGCAKLNPAFGDGSGEGMSSGDTTGAASPTSTGPLPTGPDVSTTVDPSSGTAVSTSGTLGETETPTSEGDPSTGAGPVDCEDGIGPSCDPYIGGCERTQTCWFDGEPPQPRCLPQGELDLNESCLPNCSNVPDVNCGNALVCAGGLLDDATICRPPCQDSPATPSCDVGVCFREASALGAEFGVCWGDCDPFGQDTCGVEQDCAIGLLEPVPTCVDDAAQGVASQCRGVPCPSGTVCIPENVANDCSKGSCCMELCHPALEDCPVFYSCIAFGDIGGPDVPVGFCNPP